MIYSTKKHVIQGFKSLKSNLNARVGKQYKKDANTGSCKDGVLCCPVDFFADVEQCKICKKTI